MSGAIRVRVIIPSDDPLPDLFAYVDYDKGWTFPDAKEARLWIRSVQKVWPGLSNFELHEG